MTRWQPTDDELDALARGLPAFDADAQRAEHNRTAVLANAATTTPQPARRPWWPLLAAPLAAAAAIAIWLGTRPATTATTPHEKATIAGAFAGITDWPDRVVRVDAGTVTIALDALAPGERFRVLAPDAELETTAARFELAVADAHLQRVAVATGRVGLRVVGAPPVFLAAGQVWTRTITAQREPLIEPAPAPAPTTTAEQPSTTAPRAEQPSTTAPRAETTPPSPSETPPLPSDRPRGTPKAATPPPPAPPPAPPGEADFRAGMTALRGGDAAAAATSFAAACAASHSALADDACFWSGAAARRAGQTAAARRALEQFIARFPSSARAGEAAALLGWIVLEGGDPTEAERLFQRAASDRVPQVRDSAARGLAAVSRNRGQPSR